MEWQKWLLYRWELWFRRYIKNDLEDAVKYFFGVINDDFYYSITDNIFELSYEEVIKYAKDNNFYDSTYEKLNLLINNDKPTIEFYKSLV